MSFDYFFVAQPQERLVVTILILIAILMALAIVTIGPWTYLPRLLVWLADFDEWWSSFRPNPPEGEMYGVARGGPNGPFDRLLESVPTHSYDGTSDTFELNTQGYKDKPSGYLARLGISWVGFNKSLIVREVRYDKWEKIPDTSTFGLVSKERTGPAIFFQYNMAVVLERAETVGNFPVSITVNLTVQIFGPRRALFLAGGWVSQVVAGTQGVLRQYVSSKTIDVLREEKLKGGSTELITLLSGNNPDCLNARLEQFGVSIIDAKFIDFDDVSGDAETSRAIKAKQIAELEGDASIVAAEKAAAASTHKAVAITREYEARIAAAGEHAGTFRLAEAIEKTPLQALNTGVVVGLDKK